MKFSPYALKPKEPLRQGLPRVLRKMTRDAGKLGLGADEEEESIHTIRLLIKRTRALLWLVTPVLSSKVVEAVKTDLRRAAGGLSAQRDSVVVRATLRSLDPKKEKARNQIEAIAQVWSEPADLPDSGALPTAREILLKALPLVENEPRDKDDWPDPEKRLAKAERAMKRTARRAIHSGDDEKFHEWRKKTKRFGYLLEFLREEVRHPIQKRMGVDQLQHFLGEYHDCVVTEEKLAREKNGPGIEEALHLLKKKKKALAKKARALMEK